MPTPLPTQEELEARFRACWSECFPFAKPASHAVTSAAAFALAIAAERDAAFRAIVADPNAARDWLQQAGFTDADGLLLNRFR
jgi:hypothetical protein